MINKLFHHNQNTEVAFLAIGLVVAIILLTIGLHTFTTSRTTFGADFWTFWLGGRAVFLDHNSPYTQQVTLQSQQGIYGRPALPGEDQVRFSYPIYSLLPVYPASFLSFDWALAYWFAFHFIVFMAAMLWAFPDISKWIFATLVFFYPVMRGLILGQFAITLTVVILLVYGFFWRWNQNSTKLSVYKQFWVGVLFAWTTIKPQFVWLMVIVFLLWAWQEKWWGFICGFLGGFAGWFLLGELWYGGWFVDWINQARFYVGNLPNQLLAFQYAESIFLHVWFGSIILAALGLFLLITGILWWQDICSIEIPMGIAALLTIVANPQIHPSEQLVILLPFLIWIQKNIKNKSLYWYFVVFGAYWFFFIRYFQGKEPLSISFYLPLLYALWLGVVSFKAFRLTKQARSVVME